MSQDWRQLHVRVDADGLDGMITRLTEGLGEALAASGHAVPREVLENALQKELTHYVVGMDLCGLSSVCADAQEYDPWDAGKTG